jgi:O-antigen ligase
MVFAAGLAVGYYGQRRDGRTRLVRDVCAMGSLACAAVIAVAVAAGNFHVFDVGWRLGSVGRENQISWVAALPFLAAYVTRHNGEIWPAPWARAGILVLTGTVLLLSKSRTTVIAVAAGLIVSELVTVRAKRRIAAVAVFGCLLVVIISSTWFDQFWRRGASEDQLQTVSGRTVLWQTVWRDICLQPLLGYGFGAYWTANRVNLQEVEWAPTSAHSGYLETAAELGFTGLVIITVFIAMCWRDAWRLIGRSRESRDIGILLLAVITCFVVINFTESYVDSIEYFPVLATLTLAFYVSYLHATVPVRQRHQIPCP